MQSALYVLCLGAHIEIHAPCRSVTVTSCKAKESSITGQSMTRVVRVCVCVCVCIYIRACVGGCGCVWVHVLCSQVEVSKPIPALSVQGVFTVCEATWAGETVAFKRFFKPSDTRTEQIKEKAENEAFILSQFRHPNIHHLYGKCRTKQASSACGSAQAQSSHDGHCECLASALLYVLASHLRVVLPFVLCFSAWFGPSQVSCYGQTAPGPCATSRPTHSPLYSSTTRVRHSKTP